METLTKEYGRAVELATEKVREEFANKAIAEIKATIGKYNTANHTIEIWSGMGGSGLTISKNGKSYFVDNCRRSLFWKKAPMIVDLLAIDDWLMNNWHITQNIKDGTKI
jgi:hypothetical protein